MSNDTKLRELALVPSTGSIDAYINWVNQIPVLTACEEQELANRFRLNGDIDAARRLVLANLRFVVHVAKGYLGYGLAKSDLIQEGNIGLMKAVKRFDPSVGVRLISFAVHWIKAEIHEFVLRNWRIVKIATTKAQRKLFFNLRRAPKKLNWFSNDEVMNVAEDLKVDPKEVRAMEARMHNVDLAFDGYNNDNCEDDGVSVAPVHYLQSDVQNPVDEVLAREFYDNRSKRLTEVLSRLDQRSREIVENRWLKDKKPTLHELAAKYNISAERVRQVEENAIKKLKKGLLTCYDLKALN